MLALSVDGSFTFAAAVAKGAAYAVTVSANPASPSQTCTVANGSGTVADADIADVAVSCTTNTFTVGGTLSGLSGMIELEDNGADTLSLSANGSFTFATALTDLMSYVVSIFAQPASQLCTPSNVSGALAGANVSSVVVDCYTFPTVSYPTMTHFWSSGNKTFTLPAPTSNSSGAFSYTSSNPSVATVSGNVVTFASIGTTTITATEATSTPYSATTTSAYLQAYGDQCVIPVCHGHGTCTDVPPNGYSCACDSGYFGAQCSLTETFCDGVTGGNPGCFNGGTCMPSSSGGFCECTSDFTGDRCDTINNPAA